MTKRGYELVDALRHEADDTRSPEREQLMRDAASEIEMLIEDGKKLRQIIIDNNAV